MQETNQPLAPNKPKIHSGHLFLAIKEDDLLLFQAYFSEEKSRQRSSEPRLRRPNESRDHETPLITAARLNRLIMLKMLLCSGANINAVRRDGASALYIAADEGHIGIVLQLLAVEANVDQANKNGEIPLRAALKKGHMDIVYALLEAGSNALCLAAAEGNLEFVLQLLALGVNVNQTNEDGNTPLWAAARRGRSNLITTLLNADAIIDQANNEGVTPLSAGVKSGCKKVVAQLLQAGADPNQTRLRALPPLFIAARSNDPAMVSLLLEAKATINQTNQSGHTPIFTASYLGHQHVVSLLIEAKAKVNQVDKRGNLPLHIAAERKHESVFALLLDAKTTDRPRNNGDTALAIVLGNGDAAIAAQILKRHPKKISTVVENGSCSKKNPFFIAELLRAVNCPTLRASIVAETKKQAKKLPYCIDEASTKAHEVHNQRKVFFITASLMLQTKNPIPNTIFCLVMEFFLDSTITSPNLLLPQTLFTTHQNDLLNNLQRYFNTTKSSLGFWGNGKIAALMDRYRKIQDAEEFRMISEKDLKSDSGLDLESRKIISACRGKLFPMPEVSYCPVI